MTKIYFVLAAGFVIASCTRSSDNGGAHHEEGGDSTNQILYNQVMDIHDEVMPKLEELYNLKKDLQEKIANTPGLVIEERKKLELRIARIDSASDMMMDWMHEFSPLPDTADQEQSRAYLESEMERIRKVKEVMTDALREGDGN